MGDKQEAKTGFLYDDIYLRHLTGAGHPERPERLTELVQAVSAVVGKKVQLEFRHETPPSRQNRDRPQGVSMRELVRQSYEQPLVRQAVELFDAEVTRVQSPHNDQA